MKPVVAHFLYDLNFPAKLEHNIQKGNFWGLMLSLVISFAHDILCIREKAMDKLQLTGQNLGKFSTLKVAIGMLRIHGVNK